MAEGGRRKNFMKESILFGIPPPSLESQTENSLAIAAACSQQQVLLQDLLPKNVNRIVGRKYVPGNSGQLPAKTEVGKQRLHWAPLSISRYRPSPRCK